MQFCFRFHTEKQNAFSDRITDLRFCFSHARKHYFLRGNASFAASKQFSAADNVRSTAKASEYAQNVNVRACFYGIIDACPPVSEGRAEGLATFYQGAF
jgi:hypothetical protein